MAWDFWDFIPSSPTLLAYSLASLVLFITPGPDMSFYLARTLQGGRRSGIAAMSGALSGCFAHTIAAALGLSALIAASSTAFGVLKVVGALYLLWMAYEAIRHGSALTLQDANGPAPSVWRTFLMGLGINLTNPKVVLFFLTFLPQFVEAGDPHAPQKLFFLGTWFVLICSPLATLQILIADRFIAALRSSPRLMRRIDYTFAGVFGFFAVQILRTGAR
jgi:threonine/homoserine/homoserine lactone efflux protein